MTSAIPYFGQSKTPYRTSFLLTTHPPGAWVVHKANTLDCHSCQRPSVDLLLFFEASLRVCKGWPLFPVDPWL